MYNMVEVEASMVWERKVGEGVGGKSGKGRGCDNCVRRSAGWYCAADDAFLCGTCDASVHSANPLARRHERVRLKTNELHPPSWHQGFTQKAPTPRRHKKRSCVPMHLVPEQEACSEEEESEEYRVPVFNNPILIHDLESLLEFDFDMGGLEDEGPCLRIDLGREGCGEEEKNKMLKLDYERVMTAWEEKRSPWMSGEREARVSRYREKRRRRLFSKKIRYEVRKLNAEKRPRIKGRFVKRSK